MDPGDIDRKLEEAAARSPEIAAMLAGKHRDDGSSRYRRLALLVAGAAVAVAILWFAVARVGPRRGAPDRPREPAEEVDRSHYLRPIKADEVAPGEATAPFQGFAISVETDPPASVVSIGGVPRGESPVLANLDCRPGTRVDVSAERAGFRPAHVQTECRADTLVKLTLRLSR